MAVEGGSGNPSLRKTQICPRTGKDVMTRKATDFDRPSFWQVLRTYLDPRELLFALRVRAALRRLRPAEKLWYLPLYRDRTPEERMRVGIALTAAAISSRRRRQR